MTDDTGGTASTTPVVRLEFVDSLPGGRTVLPVETDGELIWLIVRGQMTEQLRADFNESLSGLLGLRLWEQNWDGAQKPPPQLRRVS